MSGFTNVFGRCRTILIGLDDCNEATIRAQDSSEVFLPRHQGNVKPRGFSRDLFIVANYSIALPVAKETYLVKT